MPSLSSSSSPCLLLLLLALASSPLMLGVHASEETCSDPASCAPKYSFPHTDPYTNYNKEGVKKGGAGELASAEMLFRAAALHSGHRGDVWSNLGLCLHQQAQALQSKDDADEQMGKAASRKNDILGKMREAIAALDLGIWLKNEPAKAMRTRAVESLEYMVPGKCADLDCPRYKLEMDAMSKTLAGDHIKATNLLCTDHKYLNVVLNKKDVSMGILTAMTARRLYIIMRVCGVVAIKDVFDKSLLNTIKEDQAKEFDKFYSERKKTLQTKNNAANEWVDAAERGDLRYEVKFPIREPYTRPEFVTNRFILAFAKLMLSDRIEIDTFSTVTSLPGAPDQNWHGDVSPILDRSVIGAGSYLPPQGLVTVVPLVKIDDVTGPTEFLMGSHVNMGIDYWKDNTETKRMKMYADVGSVVVFDLRIQHRGTANNSPSIRPIVYMSFVHDWFYDKVNFKERQTRLFDSLDKQRQKLFTRLDSNRYITMLEEMLVDKGVDIKKIQSEGKYKKVDLHA